MDTFLKPEITGMASVAQIIRINELFITSGYTVPTVPFLKHITNGRAGTPEELTRAQANEAIKALIRK